MIDMQTIKLAFVLIVSYSLLGVSLGHSQSVRPDPAQPLDCRTIFQRVWADKPNNTPDSFIIELEHALSPAAQEGACGTAYLNALKESRETALDLYKPARKSIFAALENYSTQQQTSTNSSTASVSPTSKVTGLSGIAEEFSGVSLSSGTSALTFQFAPGSMLSHLEGESIILPCSPVLLIKSNCVSGAWQTFAERLTLSISTNTSAAAQSIKGTAPSVSSGSTSTLATLTNAGSTEPAFGGFGVKITALYQEDKSQKPSTSAASQKLDAALSKASAEYANALISCSAFDTEAHMVASALATQSDEVAYLQLLQTNYPLLGLALSSCLNGNKNLVGDVQDFLASVLLETAAGQDLTAGKTPMLGFEYDLNTPQNQPSYSSLKGNFSWALSGNSKSKSTDGANPCKGNQARSVHTACAVAAAASQPSSAATKTMATAGSAADNKAAAAKDAKPLTINASVAADIYNAEPPSSIPSASHLRDVVASFEIDYLVPTSKIKSIGALIGDSTLAGTYYYQDQTSPSILKGPPSSVTIAGLPSTATQIYTARGPINLGQIRYGLGTGTNVSFPICFTYSNRSGLITHPIKGLQFGLSYNLSSLFSSKAKSGSN